MSIQGTTIIEAIKKANKTKSDRAYIIGMLEPHNPVRIYFDGYSKKEIEEMFLNAINKDINKTAEALKNSSYVGKLCTEYLEQLPTKNLFYEDSYQFAVKENLTPDQILAVLIEQNNYRKTTSSLWVIVCNYSGKETTRYSLDRVNNKLITINAAKY